MYYFCTYFDQNYLTRGLALYESLQRHCPSFKLWVLCMDQECYDILQRIDLSNINLIHLKDFENSDEEVLKAKQNRTMIEYYFTCTPSLSLFILNNHPEVDLITYLDADLFFFEPPQPIYDEIADNSIAIIGHRFPPRLRFLEEKGRYNVGWLSFQRDAAGLACLQWWREQCLDWCYDKVDGERYADQKYLDQWPRLFPGVVELRHKGANLAPWNLANYEVRCHGGRVWIDEDPLIFYHFHDLRRKTDWLYDPKFAAYGVKSSKVIRNAIYGTYIRALNEVSQKVISGRSAMERLNTIREPEKRAVMSLRIKRLIIDIRNLLTNKYIIYKHNKGI